MSFKKESCTNREKDCMTHSYKTDQKNIIIGKSNNYRIDTKKILGRGAFSVVYLGTNIDTQEKVAIKKISLNKLTNKEIDVIDREIKIVTKLIKLSNPYKNIVTYYDVIKSNTIIFIIMEMCPDGTLSSLLVKPMKEKFTRYYFKQILDSLNSLQELNIVHKDIKPDNILIFNDYRTLKICDFGFSQDFKELDNDNQLICGSPIYMAPEMFQAKSNISGIMTHMSRFTSTLPKPIPHRISSVNHRSDDYDHHVTDNENYADDDLTNNPENYSYLSSDQTTNTNSDLWSAGMIFYEMVYGYHPHRGSKDIHTIKKKLENSIKILEMPWIDLGEDGFQLLRGILDPNSLSRITIDKVMKHRWTETSDDPIKKIVLSELFYASDLRFVSRSLPQTLEFDRYMANSSNNNRSMYTSDVNNQIIEHCTNNLDSYMTNFPTKIVPRHDIEDILDSKQNTKGKTLVTKDDIDLFNGHHLNSNKYQKKITHATSSDSNRKSSNNHTNQIINNGAFDVIIKMHNEKVNEKKSDDAKKSSLKINPNKSRDESNMSE